MSLRASLALQLRRYDDEAFIAMANRGLLRRARKDLETQQPEIIEEGANSLALSFSGHQITFDARGPALAGCSCPTPGVCQHVLATALWLQKTEGEESIPTPAVTQGVTNESSPAEAMDTDPLASLRAELLGWNRSDLIRHAGKPGYRWAWQFVQDLDLETDFHIGGERNIAIGFHHPRIAFRYMGGGLDSLISETTHTQIAKYRVAVVLAYQRSHGVAISPPEESRASRATSLDLGKDHALPEQGRLAQRDSRSRLRSSVRELLLECINLGFSHLSSNTRDRFSTLAVWAQGAEYYRLALALRRITDHVELLLERAGGADEHRLFEEATLAFALVAALESADQRNELPAHLIGRARNRYEDVGTLELLGMGAMPWRTASGYIGLTMLFWSPTERTFLTCTDARPEMQRGFNPVARYRSPGPWTGLGSPAIATGQRLRLQGAQANAHDRLSAVERTHAFVQNCTADEFASSLAPCEDWAQLAVQRGSERRSLLAERRPAQDWATLRPTRFGRPVFDDVKQLLKWALFDGAGNQLDVQVAYSEYNRPLIERLEALASDPLREGTLVVARVISAADSLIAEPISFIYGHRVQSVPFVDALYFDEAPQRGALSRTIDRLRTLGRTSSTFPQHSRATEFPVALDEMRAWLMRQAERGIGGRHTGSVTTDLGLHVQRVRSAGLTCFSHANAPNDAGTALFQAHYINMQYNRVLGGEIEIPD